MADLQDIREQREEILRIARRHGARRLRVFGSLACGEACEDSDVDLLVELEEGRSLIDHIALEQDLEDLLGCGVDVVTETSLNELLRDKVLEEAVPI